MKARRYLTNEEKEALLFGIGYTIVRSAELMGIGPGRVGHLRERIFAKKGAVSFPHALAFALADGDITMGDIRGIIGED